MTLNHKGMSNAQKAKDVVFGVVVFAVFLVVANRAGEFAERSNSTPTEVHAEERLAGRSASSTASCEPSKFVL